MSPFPPCKMSTFSPHIFPSLYGERREDEDEEEGLEGDEMVRAMRCVVVGRRLWRRSTHRCATVVPVQDRPLGRRRRKVVVQKVLQKRDASSRDGERPRVRRVRFERDDGRLVVEE